MAKIKRIGVIKTACFLGLYGFFMGLIFALIFKIISFVIPLIFSNLLGTFFVASWLSILVIPLAFGVLNFLISLIFTPLMNLTLKIIDGIDLDIEMQQEQLLEVPEKNLEDTQNSQEQY